MLTDLIADAICGAVVLGAAIDLGLWLPLAYRWAERKWQDHQETCHRCLIRAARRANRRYSSSQTGDPRCPGLVSTPAGALTPLRAPAGPHPVRTHHG